MIRNGDSQKLAIVQKLQTFCAACGQMSVVVLTPRQYRDGDVIVERIQVRKWALCAILAISFMSVNSHAQEHFFDDFEDGNAEDGDPVRWFPSHGGVMEVVDGDYLWTPDGDYIYADVSGSEYTDVSSHTQLRLSGPIGYLTSINARGMGYFGAIKPTGELVIWCAAEWDGSFDNLDSGYLSPPVSTGLDPTANDIHLQFDLFEDELRLRA